MKTSDVDHTSKCLDFSEEHDGPHLDQISITISTENIDKFFDLIKSTLTISERSLISHI